MALHFNLKTMFLAIVALMFWHMVMPYTFGVGCMGIVFYMGWLYKKGKINIQDVILAISFIINLLYVDRLDINVKQYDYFNFFMQAVYFVENDFFVKKPITYLNSVYYQPPLWSVITALITKIAMVLGLTREEGFDEARFMSLFSIVGVCIVMWRFLMMFDFSKKIRLWVWGMFCFLPIHTIMAGLNNNDSFVYFIGTVILYVGYKWYLNPSFKNAWIIAGLLFVAGMIKFSGLMLLAYVAILGLSALINKGCFGDKKLWSEFFVIAMGAVLGFAWGIFLMYFDLPIVPPPKGNEYQVMSGFLLSDRLFDFSNIGVVFADIRNGVVEPNVWLSLVKTSLFGEWTWNNEAVAFVLYGISFVFALLFIYSFFYLFKFMLGRDFGLNLAIVVLTFAVFISWALFWIEFPYFCSTEFRYVVILVPVSFLWGANFLQQKNLPKWFEVTLASLCCLFVLAKTIVFVSTILQF